MKTKEQIEKIYLNKTVEFSNLILKRKIAMYPEKEKKLLIEIRLLEKILEVSE